MFVHRFLQIQFPVFAIFINWHFSNFSKKKKIETIQFKVVTSCPTQCGTTNISYILFIENRKTAVLHANREGDSSASNLLSVDRWMKRMQFSHN